VWIIEEHLCGVLAVIDDVVAVVTVMIAETIADDADEPSVTGDPGSTGYWYHVMVWECKRRGVLAMPATGRELWNWLPST
jgi:hypothetical protein